MNVDGVDWSDSLRAKVIPSRRFRNDAYLPTKLGSRHVDYPLDRAQCLRDLVAYSKAARRERVTTAIADNPAEWRPAVEAAIENAAHPEARGPLEVDAEVAAVTLELYPLWRALPFWVVEAGVVFALRALIRCHDVIASTGIGRSMTSTDHIIARVANESGRMAHDEWILLRSMLAEAIEPTYDEAHGIADRARLATPHTDLAVSIAFAFPDEQAWARDVARRAIELAKHPTTVFYELSTYLAVAPVTTAVALLDDLTAINLAYASFATLLAHHGRDAVPVFEKLLARMRNDQDREIYGEYLLAIRTDQAARALEKLARAKPKNRVFATLVRKHARGAQHVT